MSFGSIQRVACSVYLNVTFQKKAKAFKALRDHLVKQTFPRQLTWNGVGIL
jgi:hypothetical protein